MIRDVPDEIHTVLELGHAPGIPDRSNTSRPNGIAGLDSDGQQFRLVAAVVDVPGPWAELGKGRAELASFVVPRG